MYYFFGIFAIICIFFFIFFHFKKRKIICKLHKMCSEQKTCLLNQIAEPFGFFYSASQDIITSRVDSWQRKFGYCSLYDKSAPHFSMVFDCEPIYFNYDNRTWLIEFWKGQYGISLGAEIGIYRADTIINPWEYDKTLFHSVPDEEMLPLSFTLCYKGNALFTAKQHHWWLTGFCPGKFSDPQNLAMHVSISFETEKMMYSFLESLIQSGYLSCGVSVHDRTVCFYISCPCSKQPRCRKRIIAAWAQWKNKIFCKLYRLVTRPFDCTLDQILYLYFFLPFIFRRLLCMKKCRKQKFKKPRRKERHKL